MTASPCRRGASGCRPRAAPRTRRRRAAGSPRPRPAEPEKAPGGPDGRPGPPICENGGRSRPGPRSDLRPGRADRRQGPRKARATRTAPAPRRQNHEGNDSVAVKLRLVRMGKKKQPTYRVVAADGRSPRDGRFLEIVGTYAPRGSSTAEPDAVIKIDNDKAVKWLVNGAQATERVEKLLKTSGAWDEFTAARAK